MSKRQVIILWSIAAVLALLVTVIKLAESDPDQAATERAPGQTLFEFFPAEKITRVVVEGATQTLTIEKWDDEWLLKERDQYPADTTIVLDLIRVLNELEITRAIEASPSLASRFGMDPDAESEEDHGFEIGFFGKGEEELARVSIGKVIEANSGGGMLGGGMTVGRYVRNHADETGFYASNEMFPTVTDDAKRWLRDTFISPEKIESVAVTAEDSDITEWQLKRETEEAAFQVVDAKPNEVANASLANRLGSLFSYARFEDVIPEDQVEERLAKKGHRTATIHTFEGFTYTLKLMPTASEDEDILLQVEVVATLPEERKKEAEESEEDAKKKDEAFAKRRSQLQDKLNETKFFEGRTYLMSNSSVDLLLRNRGEMVVSVTPQPATNPAPAQGVPPALLPPGQP